MSTAWNEEFLHKAAVALNNSGAVLLQRHCYREAMDSFKNAFQLLKVCLNVDLRCESTIQTTMDAFLNISSKHMIKAFQKERNNENKNGFHLTVLSYDRYRDFHALNEAANSYESESKGYAIIICHNEPSEQDISIEYYTTKLQTESAIVLNNMTSACMAFGYRNPSCSSSIKIPVESRKRRNILYQRGLDLGTTAYQVLSCQLNGEKDYITSKYQSTLSILVLKNLMRITSYLNDIQLSREFYMKYCNKRDDIVDLDDNNNNCYGGGGNGELFQSFLAPVA